MASQFYFQLRVAALFRVATLLSVLGMVLVQYSFAQTASSNNDAVPQVQAPLVEAAMIEKKGQQFKVYGQGFLAAKQQIELTSKVAGLLVQVHENLYLGGIIQAGEILLTVDQARYQADVDQAIAALANAEAVFAQAQLTFDRQKSLREKKLVAQNAVDEAALNLSSASAGEQQAKAALAIARQQLADTQVIAPFTAHVISEQVSLGQYVSPGQTLATVFDPGVAELKVGLEIAKAKFVIAALKDAQKPAVYLQTRPKVEGYLHSTAPVVSSQSRTVDFLVRIPGGFEANDGLLLGEYVTVALPASAPQMVYAVPPTAIRKQAFVYQIKNSRLQQVPIEVLSRSAEAVLLMSSAIDPALPVSVTTLPKEQDGVAVRVKTSE